MSGSFARSLLPVTLLAALVSFFPAARAHEPDGIVAFGTNGVVAPPENAIGFEPGEKMVRLVIRGARDLDGVVLTHLAPEGISQRLATVQSPGAGARAIDRHEGESPSRIEIGTLKAGVPVILEFAERFTEDNGGVVTFTVEAVGADGKAYRESYGQVVGTPGKQGVLRNDALEFPAHEIREEDEP